MQRMSADARGATATLPARHRLNSCPHRQAAQGIAKTENNSLTIIPAACRQYCTRLYSHEKNKQTQHNT